LHTQCQIHNLSNNDDDNNNTNKASFNDATAARASTTTDPDAQQVVSFNDDATQFEDEAANEIRMRSNAELALAMSFTKFGTPVTEEQLKASGLFWPRVFVFIAEPSITIPTQKLTSNNDNSTPDLRDHDSCRGCCTSFLRPSLLFAWLLLALVLLSVTCFIIQTLPALNSQPKDSLIII
jgi:hypothetical protein